MNDFAMTLSFFLRQLLAWHADAVHSTLLPLRRPGHRMKSIGCPGTHRIKAGTTSVGPPTDQLSVTPAGSNVKQRGSVNYVKLRRNCYKNVRHFSMAI